MTRRPNVPLLAVSILTLGLGMGAGVAALQRGGPAPGAVAAAAERASEGDSAAAVRARWDAAVRRDSTDRAALLSAGILARWSYDFETAERAFGRLLAETDRTPAAPDPWRAWARLGLYMTTFATGEQIRADSLLHLAIADARRAGDRGAEVFALIGFTNTRNTPHFTAQYATIDTALRLLPPGDSKDRAELSCRLGLYHGIEGDTSALTKVRAGIAMSRRTGERQLVGHCLEALALVHSLHGRNDSSLAIMDSAAVILRATNEHAGLARVASRRSDILQTYGRLGEARAALEEVMREAAISKNRQRYGFGIAGLGMLALRTGDLPTAAANFAHAAALYDSLGMAEAAMITRQNQGEVLAASGELDAARRSFEAGYAEAERGGYLEDMVNSRQRIARVAMRQAKWDEAARQLALADSLAASQGLAEVREALAYDQGKLALGRGDWRAAERRFAGMLAAMDTADHLPRHQLRMRIAETRARRGDLAAAEREALAASAELESWRASVGADELRRSAFAAAVLGEYDAQEPIARVLAALAQGGRAEAALTLAEQRRARALTDRLYQAEALRETAAAGGRAARRDRAAAAADIVRAMPDDRTALLEYVAGTSGAPTTLFVVTRAGVRAHVLPTADSLAAPIGRLAALLEQGGSADALRRTLGAQLLGAAAAALPDSVTRLIVVPDGALYRAPFDALLLADGRPALERWAIGLAPSAALATTLRRPQGHAPGRGAGEGLLAVGDPAFGGASGGRKTGTAGGPVELAMREARDARDTEVYRDAFRDAMGTAVLPRLAGSGAEAREVARYARGEADVRLGGDASEAWLKRTPLGHYGVIHLATHALVDERSLSRTALALAPGEGEDGFVAPADLAALKLDADLVVLSACRTAGGVVVTGEGMQGLTAPLLEAGARAVVATQWRISDRKTVQLVEDFYAALAGGRPVAEALREAKLAALRRGAPAGEWAGFTVVGDPLAEVPLAAPAPRSNLRWWPALAAGAVLLLGLGYFAVRRRGRSAERGALASAPAARTHH